MGSNEPHVDQDVTLTFQNKKKKPKWSKMFPVTGKGTLFFNSNQISSFQLIVRPLEVDLTQGESWIGLDVGKNRVSFLAKRSDQASVQKLCEETSHDYFGASVGIEHDRLCTYWLSYDRERMVIKYGKGYCMERTTILEYSFKQTKENLQAFFDPSVNRTVEFYGKMSVLDASAKAVGSMEPEVEFDPVPLVYDMQPLIKDSDKANLFDLNGGRFMYSSCLPTACQVLYANVTAADIDLDFVPYNVKKYHFPLTDAIRYSIETDGCALNTRLKEKKGEFGSLELTYLRITLGKEYGTCPGVPYVLELWPKSHGSPVHNHGNAYAVIRVLHGGLTIHYYNKMMECVDEVQELEQTPDNNIKELGEQYVKKGDVTWMSPRWYQTHRLYNNTKDFCATIQCYAYGENDNTHWPYFDYLDSQSNIGEFQPDSDFGFKEMYRIVTKEYVAHRTKTKNGLKYANMNSKTLNLPKMDKTPLGKENDYKAVLEKENKMVSKYIHSL